MTITSSVGVVADDLTGANDTALQFFMKGANTEIIFEPDNFIGANSDVEVIALSSETRNQDAKFAAKKVWETSKRLKENFHIEKFYKKIDSTLRGNVAVEVLAMLDAIDFDAAVIAPAFIQEGRITIGGYQLLKGTPIERTDAARDTYAPIYDSYIPNILKKEVNENLYNSIDTIKFNEVVKGALKITTRLNELIEKGKKLIVVDAVSLVDLEQIVLAVEKSQYKILPVGSAGLANAFAQIWFDRKEEIEAEKEIPILPKVILSGSKTSITYSQIKRLSLDDDIENCYFIDLKLSDVLKPDLEGMTNRIVQNLGKDNVVVIHASNLDEEANSEHGKELLIDEGVSKELLAVKITDFLSEIAYELNKSAKFVMITLGGETSYKCTKAIDCRFLKVIDGILPAISLCVDSNGKFIVTKSGNMGSTNALSDIINYFKHHEK